MEIDIKKKKNKICIAKLPKFLADQILSLNYESEIGELYIDESTSSKISFKLHNMFAGSLPSCYDVSKIKRDSNMFVIESTHNNASVEGEVEFEYFIKPKINEQFLNFKKLQAADRNRVSKSTEIIDYRQEGRRTEKLGSLRELDYLAKKRKKMLQDKKRERLGKDDVLDIVFGAFEKYDAWTVKDLADFTGQPVAFIQEIVSEICVLNKKDHKNTYELKPEYK